MALTTALNLTLRATESAAAGDLYSPPSTVHLKTVAGQLASGVGANQADVAWSDRRTIAASGAESLDLAGVLTGALGGAKTFVKVKTILIVADPANTNDVVVGNAGGDGTAGYAGPLGGVTETVKVKPGGVLLFHAPGAAGLGTVTAATADLLGIANSSSGTAVTYEIVILGTSA